MQVKTQAAEPPLATPGDVPDCELSDQDRCDGPCFVDLAIAGSHRAEPAATTAVASDTRALVGCCQGHRSPGRWQAASWGQRGCAPAAPGFSPGGGVAAPAHSPALATDVAMESVVGRWLSAYRATLGSVAELAVSLSSPGEIGDILSLLRTNHAEPASAVAARHDDVHVERELEGHRLAVWAGRLDGELDHRGPVPLHRGGLCRCQAVHRPGKGHGSASVGRRNRTSVCWASSAAVQNVARGAETQRGGWVAPPPRASSSH